jgi:S1-C subfamily serine protease
MGLSLRQLGIYAAFLIVGGSAGWAGGYYLNSDNRSDRPEAVPAALESPPQETPQPTVRVVERNNPNFIADAVEQVGPAVVRIDSSRTIASRVPDAFQNPLLRRFFGDEVPSMPEEALF